MKKTVLALTATALLITGFAATAKADDFYNRSERPIYMDDRGDIDGGVLVQDRRFYGERRDDRYRDQVGPRQVARMLERRGYRVGDVNFERGRYFVRASRRGMPVLVIVSRDGDILDTRPMGGRGYRDRRSDNGFSIEIRPSNNY
ncbi:antifreeze protein [Phyllobacterium sp. 628]|uniref:antifreeze protein n=1 Tax=Phyllobacterium sp. 628 TaxID=2718938 RepID=UPI0016623C20|nr:antifreeze protein [Phyllobacterium sp. 628]QND53978.1 antifreeze protein [Phyllobacterium sp. 628]